MLWLTIVAFGALNFVLVVAWVALLNRVDIALGLLVGLSVVSVSTCGLLAAYFARAFFRNRTRAPRLGRMVGSSSHRAAVGSGRVRDADQLLVEESPFAERIAWLAESAATPHYVTAGFGAASRSPVALDILSMLATDGRHDWKSLCTLIDSDALVGMRKYVSGVGFRTSTGSALVQIARLLISNQFDPDDQNRAAKLLGLVGSDARLRANTNQRYVLELVISLRSLIPEYREMSGQLLHGIPDDDPVKHMLVADLLNPHSGIGSTTSEREWEAWVNGIFTYSGLEPIELIPSSGTLLPFDRLASAPSGAATSDALVTVIMSSYKPSVGIRTAVRSMISQSWRNWELLVVDDGSPADYGEILDEVAQMDDRITVVRNSENRGTYVCRNQALRMARGEFVTMQDSDDWVHPRRIEIQAKHLLGNPGMLANTCQSVRVSEELMFAQPRGTGLRITESSIFFRRSEVIELIGGFDPIRRAADGEFRLRLEAATGAPVPLIDLEAPLSLVRYDSSSLSGSDLRHGWMHPARVAYKSAHSEWRRQNTSQRLCIPFDLVGRLFPASAHLTGSIDVEEPPDVVFLLDPTGRQGSVRIMERAVREMRALVSRGHRVAVRSSLRIDLPSGVGLTHHLVQELINSGEISEVLASEAARTRVLVVRDEQALVGVSSVDSAIAADDVVLVRATDRPVPRLILDAALNQLCGTSYGLREVAEPRPHASLVNMVDEVLGVSNI
ncbi:MAG: glycosyltransferase [Actinobacteria bacterium]|nr:glycosyltransferase [Actinomycetota bacterium]MBU1609340.1 glycosyltransferase [Actinomycetota bacterium]MBU2314972.1 glycosyltransferase [Actinomycetota bacterium]MBU2385062.1 glycosyltransferase [Actinomycetota bacterium]